MRSVLITVFPSQFKFDRISLSDSQKTKIQQGEIAIAFADKISFAIVGDVYMDLSMPCIHAVVSLLRRLKT